MTINVKASTTWYEHVILDFLDRKTFKTFYDIGVGPRAEYLIIKQHFQDVDFFGLEANPAMFEQVVNKFPGTILPLAVSKTPGDVTFVIHEQNVMASGLIPYDNSSDGEKINVPSITLDEFDQKFNSQDDILLWMDIEGYELNALQSGTKLLQSGRVKLLNLEVRPRWNHKPDGCTEAEIDDLLSTFRYKKIFVYDHHPSSRHHDAIYVHESHELPESARRFTDLYSAATNLALSPDGILDLTLAQIDAAVAKEELEHKIIFLREKIKSIEQIV